MEQQMENSAREWKWDDIAENTQDFMDPAENPSRFYDPGWKAINIS
mgnify:CR=1 FL=1